MFEPFITRHSIQYANGADGKARRLVYDKIFNYDKLDIYYDRLQKVWNVVDWACFVLVEYRDTSGVMVNVLAW